MAHSGTARFKVVLVGDYGVGKSTLFRSFIDGDHHQRLRGDATTQPLDRKQDLGQNGGAIVLRQNGSRVIAEQTEGSDSVFAEIGVGTRWSARSPSPRTAVDNYVRKFTTETGQAVQIELWDTSGLERFGSLSANYYSGAVAVVVCYSLVDPLTRASATQHILDAVDHASRSPSSSAVCPLVFVCGTKSDLRPSSSSSSADVRPTVDGDENDLRRLEAEFDSVVSRSFAISCAAGRGDVDQMFGDIARTVSARWRHKSERDESTRYRLGSFDGNGGKSSSSSSSSSGGCGCG